jgi:hypothetical protein
MGAFGQVSWTIVFNEKGKDRRLHLEKSNDTVKTYAPRLDDTLGVVHYKLQQLTKENIYWWVDIGERSFESWPDARKHICPYVTGAYSMKEKFSWNAASADNTLDLLGTFTNGNTIHVCELSDLYKLNPGAESVVPITLSDQVSIHVVESTEATILAAESNDNPAKQITVSGLSTQIQFTAYNQDIDNSLIEKHDMVTGDLLMMGVQSANGMTVVRIPEQIVERSELTRDMAMSEANDLLRNQVNGGTNGLYVTKLHDNMCSTHVTGDIQVAKSYGTFDTVERATQAVMDAQCFVSKLRKLKMEKNTIPYIKWMQLNCVFESLILDKESLKHALDALSPFLFWEDTESGNVIVHYKRVPFFKAQEGKAQYVERHAYQLTDGTLEKMISDMMSQYGIDRAEVMNEIETYKIVSDSSTDDYDVSNKYMKMITDVGAMATVGVSARGMKVSLRCVGSIDYSERLLSLLSLLSQSPPTIKISTTDTSVDTSESPSVTDVSDLQQALAALKRMDQMEATHISDVPLKANMYILDRLYDHDAQIFKYGKSRFKTYAKQCGAVNMRQPIVVTPEKMSRMRADGVDVPDSIRAGEGGNYYMCPEFWCPVSEVPMTQQQVQENGGVCTSGEQPLDLTSASFWSQGSKRSPGLLAAEKHPLGLYAPCCFKNMKNMMVARIKKCQDVGQCPKDDIPKSLEVMAVQEDEGVRYVMASNAYPLPEGRKGYLPESVSDGPFDNVFRVGVSQENGPLTNAVSMAMGVTKSDLVDMILSKLSILKICQISRGNLIRRFVDQSIQLEDPVQAALFDTYMKSASGLEFKKSMQSNGNSIDRLRNFTLWNGYTGVIRYIREGQSKNHTFMLPLLMVGLDISIHVLEVKDGVFSLHCPYGYSKRPKKQSVIIIKQGVVYEPLFGETDSMKMILDGQHDEMCKRIVGPNIQEIVMNHLVNVEKLNIDAQVINLSYETVGVLTDDLFVPFKTPGPIDLDLPMIYLDQLKGDAGTKWTMKTSTALLSRLNKVTSNKWYSDIDQIDKSGSKFIVIDAMYIPISNASRVLTMAKQDLTVFVSGMDDIKEAENIGLVYDTVMAYLIKNHAKELFVLTHPLCPFSNADVLAKMMDMTSTLSDLSKEVRARVSHQLMTRQHRQAGTIYRSNEIFATEQDIVDGTFMYMLSNVEKGFDAVESSRTLFNYTNQKLDSDMIDVPIPSQWKSLLKGVSLRTLPAASYIILRKIVTQ